MAQQAHTGEKPYKSAEMVVIPRFCLKLLHTTINIKTSKRQHIDIMCVDPMSIGRRIDAHGVDMMSY